MTSNLDFNLHVYQQVKIMFAEFFHSFTEIMSIRLPVSYIRLLSLSRRNSWISLMDTTFGTIILINEKQCNNMML